MRLQISRFHLATMLVVAFPIMSTAQDATVSANDVVTLRVLNWDYVEGAVQDWTAISGDFRVGPDGMLDLPLIDPVAAAGRTPSQIGRDVASALSEQLALPEPPDATVTLESYRPVVVGGLVENPGQVEFTPGMTVRHAIALAGGPEQSLRSGTQAYRELVNTQGAFWLLSQERMRLLARLGRVRAEREGSEEIVSDEGLSGPLAARLLSEQAEIMERRRAMLASEQVALADQITLLENEIEALEQQQISLERQRDLAQEARDNVASLAGEGLVVNNRLFDSERTLALIENQVLDTSVALLRARLNVAAVQRELGEIESRRDTDVVEEMIELEARLTEVELRLETTGYLIDIDGLAVAEMLASGNVADVTANARYYIYHADGTHTAAELGSKLQPGDMVEMVMSDSDLRPSAAEVN
jgi:polysaccharide biosynthesis/export protein ExoF